ncbi:ATP-binding protein [Alteromonas genovensis]|jgi:DNA replication protein DnaC|uniref:ATP-binding protein n=1 Tax=Alteromonas genovensis TaxID=471225 RepID=A0A6N9TID0_9ALTE|nr:MULTISPECIES: ATP-binding protein [Alteromonas]MAI36170.1 flavodoxin [Alteromonas sp.]NDW17054.1 ATP-binding protein [Alteromonas genovensis]OUX91884.1 MAG: flavodoxin [Alteromonas sp. TMED35]|tara:strand:- start:6794 stop:7618 length:825 start_codon:yes stop_codon:yes gene_type:complete
MDRITDKIANLAKALNKPVDPDNEYIDYKTLRKQYEAQANEEISQLQQRSKKARVEAIHGRSDLNPKWTFSNLVEDSDDVIEAVSIAQSFIAAHDDPAWRQSGSHMMIFYGDYGRGKSHIAGAIAHQLIDQYEISVLYRQLSTILEMRNFSFDFSASDNAGQRFREIHHELLNVDLLILDEVCVNESILKKNAQSWFGNLLRQRLVNKKNCILITNHNLAELENALGRYCFESIREYDTYKVRFQGPSRRDELTADHEEESSSATPRYQPNQVR